MKEDSLYFGVFLKVVYNCIWKMTHLCIKLRKLKQVITCFLTILYDKLYIVIIFNTKERDKNEKTSKSI